jgi:hypothetical protein
LPIADWLNHKVAQKLFLIPEIKPFFCLIEITR